METNLLSLKCENHHDELTRTFGMLYESSTFVDCTLVAEGQYLKAHQAVLASCSTYFQLLFGQVKHEHPTVILKDVKFRDLKAVLDYVYKGEILISRQEFRNFQEVANSLKIKGLKDNDKENTKWVQGEYLRVPQRDIVSQGSEDREVTKGNCEAIKEHEDRNTNPMGKMFGKSKPSVDRIKMCESKGKENVSQFEEKSETHTAETLVLPGVVEETSDEIIVKEECEIEETEYFIESDSYVSAENLTQSRVLKTSENICYTGPDAFATDTHESSINKFSENNLCVSNGTIKNYPYANSTNFYVENKLLPSSSGRNDLLSNKTVIKNVFKSNVYLEPSCKPMLYNYANDHKDNWMLSQEQNNNMSKTLTVGRSDANKIFLHQVSSHERNMEPTQDVNNIAIGRDGVHEGLAMKTKRLQKFLKITEPSVHQSIERISEDENYLKQFESRCMATPAESCILPDFENELPYEVNIRGKRKYEKANFESENYSVTQKHLRANEDIGSCGNIIGSVPNSLQVFENCSSGAYTNVAEEASTLNTFALNSDGETQIEHSIEIKNEPISESLDNQDSDYGFVEDNSTFHVGEVENASGELTIREPNSKEIHQQLGMNNFNNETSEEQMRTSGFEQPSCLESSDYNSMLSDTSADAAVTSESLLMKRLLSDSMRKYNCPVCHEVFPGIVEMKDHMQQHKGKRTVKIHKSISPVCASMDKFLSLSAMNSTSAHSKDTHYKCPKCDYSTTRPWDIKIHWRIHGGERLFKCPQCKYATTTSSCLERHMRIHTVRRCHKCDFEAVQRCGLVSHMRTHKKSFKCSLCEFAASNQNWLTRHMRTHHRKDLMGVSNEIAKPPEVIM